MFSSVNIIFRGLAILFLRVVGENIFPEQGHSTNTTGNKQKRAHGDKHVRKDADISALSVHTSRGLTSLALWSPLYYDS